MKSRLIAIALLICVSTLSVSAVARTTKSTPARLQKTLVKRINQGALRVYKAFVRQSARTITVDCELNGLLEDLLLAADGLTESRYVPHNLVVVMQIASDIEQEMLATDVSADMIIAWSHLHTDLDRLAKMNGIKWSEVVITDQYIAALASDVDRAIPHSLRRASSGSFLLAFNAGTKHATNAAISNNKKIVANARTSIVGTPNKVICIARRTR